MVVVMVMMTDDDNHQHHHHHHQSLKLYKNTIKQGAWDGIVVKALRY
jgi:hypothetical protein